MAFAVIHVAHVAPETFQVKGESRSAAQAESTMCSCAAFNLYNFFMWHHLRASVRSPLRSAPCAFACHACSANKRALAHFVLLCGYFPSALCFINIFHKYVYRFSMFSFILEQSFARLCRVARMPSRCHFFFVRDAPLVKHSVVSRESNLTQSTS